METVTDCTCNALCTIIHQYSMHVQHVQRLHPSDQWWGKIVTVLWMHVQTKAFSVGAWKCWSPV